MRRILGVAGALLLIPVSFSIFLSTGRHQGSLLANGPAPRPSGSLATPVTESTPGLLSNIPAGANTALVTYVDALTFGLHTGKNIGINAISKPGCACRIIGESFKAIYTKANLIGGAYSLKQSTVIRNTKSAITLKVVIHMSNTTHIIRKTGAREIWKGVDIPAYFTLAKYGNSWKIKETSVKL